MAQCGSCDYGLPYACTHPESGYRPIVADLVREVGRLRAELAVLVPVGLGLRNSDIERLRADLATLVPIGRMYLDALDDDPANEMLTLPEAIAVTEVREAVARGEAP